MVAVKQYLKPVSTTTNKALHIDTKEMPRNCRRLSGMPKMQQQIPPSNGLSRPKLVHINRSKIVQSLSFRETRYSTIQSRHNAQ